MVTPPKKLLIGPLSTAGSGTLYQQIVDGLKREVSEGRLPPGAPLPSFRNLAADLLVSVITVKRAYEDLEREGIIYRRQGLGTFVAEAADAKSREVKKTRAKQLIEHAVREASEAGLSHQDVVDLLHQIIHENGDSSHGHKRR
jgi:GntR family transcriptional regulator